MMNNELRDSLRESYNRQAQQRDTSVTQAWKIEERSDFLSLLRQEHKHTLLEIGAGPGRDSRFFQDQGLETVCIDLSPEMVNLCQQKGLTAYVMDMADMLFPADSFDAVYALNSLLHLTKAELPGVLRRINVILKPAGLFYLGVYGGYDHEGVSERDFYTPKRFFSFYSDEHLRLVITEVFDILSFKRIALAGEQKLHFQSLILRKRTISDPTPYPDVNAVLCELLSGVQSTLRNYFVGMYVGGSLATGDFDHRRSDIDFLVVTTDEIPKDMVTALQTMHARIAAGHSKWAKELEGCYIPQHSIRRYNPSQARYPLIERYGRLVVEQSGSDQVIQRHILREHGIVLAGPALHTLIDPISPKELRQAVLDILQGWWALMLSDPGPQLNSPGYRAYAVLTMCRMLYTLEHGTIVSKPVAARWAHKMLGQPQAAVIERALAWEQDAAPVDLSETLDIIQYTLELSRHVRT